MLRKKIRAVHYQRMNNKKFLLILLTSLFLIVSLSCNSDQVGLGIYLVDTGELVLSDNEIQTYHSDDSSLELNPDGIEKWNSYLASVKEPKLSDSLFAREFVLKIEGREICRGKFWSFVSSTSCPEIVILDSLFPLNADHNILWIKGGYPATEDSLDTTISSELTRFFNQRNKPE